MHNIEIHGLGAEKARDLKYKIFALVKNEPYREEVVVSIFPSIVEDTQLKPWPFLRLINEWGYNFEITELLKTLGMPIQRIRIDFFIPAPTIKEVEPSDS